MIQKDEILFTRCYGTIHHIGCRCDEIAGEAEKDGNADAMAYTRGVQYYLSDLHEITDLMQRSVEHNEESIKTARKSREWYDPAYDGAHRQYRIAAQALMRAKYIVGMCERDGSPISMLSEDARELHEIVRTIREKIITQREKLRKLREKACVGGDQNDAR